MKANQLGEYYKGVTDGIKNLSWDEIQRLPTCQNIGAVCGYRGWGKCFNPNKCEIEIGDGITHSFKFEVK